MNIKLPAGYDVSHWEGRINWGNVTPRPRIVWCKASEGDYYTDDTFAWNFEKLAEQGIYRGAYHFHRKAISATAQGRRFCDVVRPYITDKDYLVLDVEEGGETAAQLQAWFEYVRGQFPGNPVMIYSRKNLLDPIAMFMGWLGLKPRHPLNAIAMTQAERDYFRQIPVWTAGYPSNPDLYNSVPAFYVPDQSKWGPVWGWQYSENGAVTGINAVVDLDWLAPEFLLRLPELGTPPPPDEIKREMLFGGNVERVTGHLNTPRPINFTLDIIETARAGFVVTPAKANGYLDPMRTTDFAKKYDTDLAINGDEGYPVGAEFYMKRRAMSKGVRYGLQNDGDTISVSQAAPYVISDSWNGYGVMAYNAISGSAQLLQGGGYGNFTDDLPPDPRTCMGWTADGKRVFWLTVDGRGASQGMTKRECADLLQSYGAAYAVNLDGGGSTTKVQKINGVQTIVNQPSDASGERYVANHWGIKFTGVEPMPTTDYYEYTALGNRAIRTGPGATYGRIASGSDFLVNTKAKGGATAADRVTLTAETAPAVQGQAGDVWVRVYDNNGKVVEGWTALIHRGVEQITQRLITVASPLFATLDITVTDPNTGKKYGATGIQLPEVP